GSIPTDNPIPGSYVYAWGLRNIQGLTMTPEGDLYSAEYGDAIEDEVNWVRPLHNYGWPLIEGLHDTPEEEAVEGIERMSEPIRSWTPVIAPAGMAYYGSDAISQWKGSLLLVTLKSQRSEEHTSELQSRENLVCRLLLEKKKKKVKKHTKCKS